MRRIKEKGQEHGEGNSKREEKQTKGKSHGA